MSEQVENEEKIKVVIHGKVYWFDKNISSVLFFKKDNTKINTISFRTPQKISFKIGDIENKDIDATSLNFHANGNISTISFPIDSPQKISFKIGDIENKDIDAKSLNFHANGNILSISFPIDSPQKISFKIGDIENKDIDATSLNFHANGNISTIYFPIDLPQKISLKIGDIDYEVFSNWISLNDNTLLENIAISQDIEDYFYYKKKKYKLSFKSGDVILFDAMGNLQDWCIKNSQTRMQKIEEQDRLYKLEEEQKKLQTNRTVATWIDLLFVLITCGIGFYFILSALGLCFGKPIWPFNLITPENFDKMCFNYGFSFLNPEHETFNKYTFFDEILKRAPIIILVILGFKFLQLAFKRIELVGEVEKVQKYINLTNDDTTKNKLLKIIALPFFVPKKMKSSVVAKLKNRGSSVALEGKEETY